MSYDPCSLSRDNRLLHEGGCATSVSSLKAGMDTADSDITRLLRPSTMPAGGVCIFSPRASFPLHSASSLWNLHSKARDDNCTDSTGQSMWASLLHFSHLGITTEFRSDDSNLSLCLKLHRACRRTQECGQYC